MAAFTYKATDRTGSVQTGVIDAANQAGAIQKLKEKQLYPISIEAKSSKSGSSQFEFDLKKYFVRVKMRDVLEFTSKLSTLIESGVQLDRALAISLDLTDNPKMKSVILEIRRKVQAGSSFGDALAMHPTVFNRLYVNMVRSGEAGGVLESILQRLAGFLESSQELRNEVVSASIYPVLLSTVGGLVVTFMVSFVLPKFTVIFSNMGADLPLSTKILVQFTEFAKSYWYFILGIIIIAAIAGKQYVKTKEGRLKWDDIKLKMPMVGDLMQKIEIARFSRTLGTLVRSGVPILQALSIVKETVSNQVISNSLLSVYSRLKEGGGLATPLKETGVFPPLAVHMIAVGEETGSFEAMLIKVADTYETEVRITVKRVMALIEPLMILAMGLIVGFIVVSMLMAVFSISDMPI